MSLYLDYIISQIRKGGIKLIFLFLMSFSVLGFTLVSCSHEDEPNGGLPSMQWKTDVHMDKHGKIKVPSRRGTYEFTCTNYNRVWIAWIHEQASDGTDEVYKIFGENGDYTHMITPWGEVSAQKNVITVELNANHSLDSRRYTVAVTEGDVFFQFVFEQAGM